MSNILVIAPNKYAINTAVKSGLIPNSAKHAVRVSDLHGYHNPTVYLIDYSIRNNSYFHWGSMTLDGHRELMIRSVKYIGADIIRVEI